MFCLKEYREPKDRLSDYLPWAALVAPGVVLQKGCVLQKTIAFRGSDLATSSNVSLVNSIAKLNNSLKRLGSGWALFCEAQRFNSNNYPESDWPNFASQIVDLERQTQFEGVGNHFESSYYLTFVYKLESASSKKIQAMFFEKDENDSKSERAIAQENQRDIEFFVNKVGQLVGLMQDSFADVGELDDDQTLSYLHSTISMNRHPIKTPPVPMYLDAILPDQTFTPGHTPMLGNYFLPTLTFTQFPFESYPGLLDELNHLGVEYRWVNRFIYMSKSEAEKELTKYRKRWWQKRKTLFTMFKEQASGQESALQNTAAENKAIDADVALQELGADLAAFGYMTCTVTVWDKDLVNAKSKLAIIRDVIQNKGFSVIEETFNSKEAWLGSLPGHVYANIRRPILHTINLAHIMPLSATWAGSHINEHLLKETGVGESHLIGTTIGQTPFNLNLNVGDVGHTLMIGPTGAGKSTALCLLELQWLKYPNAQVIIFDKDKSARAATLAVGGVMFEPGNEKAEFAFQPLADIDTQGGMIWASEWILGLLEIQNHQCTPDDKKEVFQALANLSSHEKQQRTLTVFCDIVQNVNIRKALSPYTLEGTYGQLFDADHDDFKTSSWTMIEMNSLMDMGEAAVIPALDYLFYRVEQKFDGRPTLLVLDESWLFLDHPVFMPRIKNWLKTLRKKIVYVVFATQEMADAINSPIMPTILSACQTKIYLPDEEAEAPAMREAYVMSGLSDTEIKILAQATKKRHYYYKSIKGRRLFELVLGPVALTFVGMSSEKDHIFLDQMVKTVEPQHYTEAMLKHRGLYDAAQTVASWHLNLREV